jgi:hypothetical protein
MPLGASFAPSRIKPFPENAILKAKTYATYI